MSRRSLTPAGQRRLTKPRAGRHTGTDPPVPPADGGGDMPNTVKGSTRKKPRTGVPRAGHLVNSGDSAQTDRARRGRRAGCGPRAEH